LALKAYCEQQGLKGPLDTLEDLLDNHGPQIFKLIEQDLLRLAAENKFNSLEKVKGNFRLVTKEFEVGTILTPTMKLRRNEAKSYFREIIEEIYSEAEEN
jgi:long-subunit acyl-CoA synthetase (AMP-forming)